MSNFNKLLATATALSLAAGVNVPTKVQAEGAVDETPVETIDASELTEAKKSVEMAALSLSTKEMVTKNTVSDEVELLEALADDNISTIYIEGEIQLSKQLDIKRSVILDLQGNTITASENFWTSYENDAHLVQVGYENINVSNVTIKNGTLLTTEKNKHTLNVYYADNVVLEGITLNHNNSFKGAPLVVNGSNVILNGNISFVTGANSWYAANVDKNGTLDIENASLSSKGDRSDVFAIGIDSRLLLPEGFELSEDGKIKPIVDSVEVSTEDELKAALVDEKIKTITLKNDIELNGGDDILTSQLQITRPVTLDLNTHKIFGDEDFIAVINPGNNNWRANLISILSDNVTIKNGTLEAGINNRNVVNVQNVSNVVLEDLNLEHTGANAGAPLIVNGSNVTLKGHTNFVTGEKSWYAANVDKKAEPNATLTFDTDATVTFSDENKNYIVYKDDAGTVVGEVKVNDKYEIDENGKVTVKETTPEPEPTPEPDPIYPPYVPSTPTVEGSETESGKDVDVEEVRTDKDVKEEIGRENIITSVQIEEEIDEPVELTVKVGKDYKDETVYVVQQNPETGELELVATTEVDRKGYAEFVTESTEELTLTTSLPDGFINTVATSEEPSVTYYVEDNEFVKGWLELEEGWYFFDYETAQKQSKKWIAEGDKWYKLDPSGVMYSSTWLAKDSTGEIWYYVDENGAMVTNTIVDGYYINSLGQWKK